jgi:hypothetical protein
MFANLFKTAMLASAVVVPSVVLAAPQQALAEKSNFQFYNNSSETIYYVYIGESSLPTWGDDLLGNQILPPGSSFQGN